MNTCEAVKDLWKDKDKGRVKVKVEVRVRIKANTEFYKLGSLSYHG